MKHGLAGVVGVMLAVALSGCASGESEKARLERQKLAEEMCDTNEGGYYHIDKECFEGYMGR